MIRLGIEIGGTKTHAVAVDADSRVLVEVIRETGKGPDQVLASAVGAAHSVLTRLGVPLDQVATVGVGVPGSVHRPTGRVTHAVNLEVAEIELGAELGVRLGRAVVVENDVKAAALGAYHLGKRTGSLAYLNLGTGLAAGLVLDGRVWRGAGGLAGEIGHLPVDPHGELCGCGQRGCLETIASGSGLTRLWPGRPGEGVAALWERADEGDLWAIAARGRFVEGVASAVRIVVLATGVDRVMLGGGVSSLGDRLRQDVGAVLDAWAAPSPFLASAALSGRLEVVPDRHLVGAVGAALVAVS